MKRRKSLGNENKRLMRMNDRVFKEKEDYSINSIMPQTRDMKKINKYSLEHHLKQQNTQNYDESERCDTAPLPQRTLPSRQLTCKSGFTALNMKEVWSENEIDDDYIKNRTQPIIPCDLENEKNEYRFTTAGQAEEQTPKYSVYRNERTISKSLFTKQTSGLSVIPKYTKAHPEYDYKTTREYLNIHDCIFLPDDRIKENWDIFITLFLIFTAIVTPFRISFYDYDSMTWVCIDSIVDGVFGIDIIVNFFTAYYDEDDNLILNKKKIAMSYLKSWFLIDSVSIIPISLILDSSRDYTSLARIARLPRLYRIIKMTKLMRMLKIMKERNKFIKYLNEFLRLSVAIERLIYFGFIFLLLCHVCACMWYLIAKMQDLSPETWVVKYNLEDQNAYEVYITCLYFTVTIITTVGFGDITAGTTSERGFAAFVMVIGVISYSFAISSLSSVISSLDSKQAKLKEKLSTLEELKKEYRLSHIIYLKLKKALKYDHSKNYSDKFEFINELPQTLRNELSVIIHQSIITKVPFFQNRTPQFITFIGPMLRPVKVNKGEYVFLEKDPVDEIYFLVHGAAALALKKYNDLPYVYIDEGYYFGETDILYYYEDDEPKRMFSVIAIEDCELLAISKEDLLQVDIQYHEIVKELLQNAVRRIDCFQKIQKSAKRYAKSHKSEKFNPRTNTKFPMAYSTKIRSTFKHGSPMAFGRSLGEIDRSNDEDIVTDEELDLSHRNEDGEQSQQLSLSQSNSHSMDPSPTNSNTKTNEPFITKGTILINDIPESEVVKVQPKKDPPNLPNNLPVKKESNASISSRRASGVKIDMKLLEQSNLNTPHLELPVQSPSKPMGKHKNKVDLKSPFHRNETPLGETNLLNVAQKSKWKIVRSNFKFLNALKQIRTNYLNDTKNEKKKPAELPKEKPINSNELIKKISGLENTINSMKQVMEKIKPNDSTQSTQKNEEEKEVMELMNELKEGYKADPSKFKELARTFTRNNLAKEFLMNKTKSMAQIPYFQSNKGNKANTQPSYESLYFTSIAPNQSKSSQNVSKNASNLKDEDESSLSREEKDITITSIEEEKT